MSKKFSIVVVDDEPLSIEYAIKCLSHRNDIEIIAECKNGFECIQFFKNHKADIMLLDIQMPQINGFELLEILYERPSVVFCTAFDEYAIKAFEENAVDYVLKPYSKERLNTAIDRCIEEITLKNINPVEPQKLAQRYNEIIHRIVIRQGYRIIIIPINQIIYIESAENYVKIKTADGSYLKEQTMKYFESSLPQEMFLRLHRSYIVNINYLKSIEPYTKDSYIATLYNNETIKVSQEGYKRFRQRFS